MPFKKSSIILIVFLLAVIVLVIGYFLTNFISNKKVSFNQSKESGFSEAPNAEKFNEFFSEIYLAKIPAGETLTPDYPLQELAVFSQDDQFCTIVEPKKAIPPNIYASAVYDVNLKKYIKEKTVFTGELSDDVIAGCGNLPGPSGKYEYKAYISGELVRVIPFEIK